MTEYKVADLIGNTYLHSAGCSLLWQQLHSLKCPALLVSI